MYVDQVVCTHVHCVKCIANVHCTCMHVTAACMYVWYMLVWYFCTYFCTFRNLAHWTLLELVPMERYFDQTISFLATVVQVSTQLVKKFVKLLEQKPDFYLLFPSYTLCNFLQTLRQT